MVDPLHSRAGELDAADPLAPFRERFVFADDLLYLDGNSLGRLPVATRERLRRAVEVEWGTGLIRSWDSWIDLAREAGDTLATGVLDASPGEVIVTDSTSVNLYKLASAALDARPGRRVIVVEDDNFPTDRYVLEGLAKARGLELRTVAVHIDHGVQVEDLTGVLDSDVALVCLSHVAYRSGARADMPAITEAVHQVGALMLWDLCHAAGAVPTPLHVSGADLAVGCTYKYLNAGPGAPAYVYVKADLQTSITQPIWGWFGQRDQFAMGPDYEPAAGIQQFMVGSPQIFGLMAVIEGARITAEAGIEAIAAKGAALTTYAIELFDEWIAPHGWALATPREAKQRGAHVTVHHPAAWQVTQALKDAGVIPDFRTPDRLRIGFAPLYTRFEDVHEGFTRLRTIIESGSWQGYSTARSRIT
ncbi:kynureninase [Virgisporangium aliadipatigenens]|uniref:Kynureninase n=1 Tax=Virgisporangium aliadipatigenens TaxID=741659 RepID=A0A8J3YWV0_9ACTN|nr:kynureninase [Virgisporangium aliadipatigenens]GIJ52068.1 kynureninase [Virgisporangium aliadipatigenens]